MTWKEVAELAPIVTTSIAFCAFVTAAISIAVQKAIARRRAAIDFFLKTEMDAGLLSAYTTFNSALVILAEADSIDEFSKTKHYHEICDYLAVHELMALGVRKRVFDERTCYAFWSAVLSKACGKAGPVIEHVRGLPGYEYTYAELIHLHRRWSSKPRVWQHWRRGLKKPAPPARLPALSSVLSMR